MSEMAIRSAAPKDAETLLVLIDIASGGFVPSLFTKVAPAGMPVEDFIVARMGNPDSGLSYGKLWVVEIDGSVAGFIALDQTPETVEPIDPNTPDMFRPLTELENEAPGCCLINLVATFPEFRGQGAGLALMKFAETRRGTNGLCLTVGDTNVAAQEFYQRLGYRVAARRAVVKDGWNTPYSDWLLMAKQ
jgi:ribosomal protein S18 acetylase RimI-like enzyme